MIGRLDLTKEGLVIYEEGVVVFKSEDMVDPSREGLVLDDTVLPLEPGAWVVISGEEDLCSKEGDGITFHFHCHLIPIKELKDVVERHLRRSTREVIEQEYVMGVVAIEPSSIGSLLEAGSSTNGVLVVYQPSLATSWGSIK